MGEVLQGITTRKPRESNYTRIVKAYKGMESEINVLIPTDKLRTSTIRESALFYMRNLRKNNFPLLHTRV